MKEIVGDGFQLLFMVLIETVKNKIVDSVSDTHIGMVYEGDGFQLLFMALIETVKNKIVDSASNTHTGMVYERRF